MLKYLVFAGALTAGVPAGVFILNQYPRLQHYVLTLLVFLTVKTVDINFISREWYRGTSKGFEISLVDLLLLSMAGYLIFYRKEWVRKWPPGTLLYALYFFLSMLSMVNAAEPLFSAFELLKMLRMYLMFWVVYQWVRHPKQLQQLYYSIGVAMLYIFVLMLKQKYLEGVWQAHGPFPHQNSLVMYVNLFNCLLFSYAFNQSHTKIKTFLWALGCCGMGVLCTLFTFSRGGLLFLAMGLAIVFCLSMRPKSITRQKLGILVCITLAATGIGIKAADSIQERFDTAPEESMEVRAVLAIAALKMVKDKPLGVGLNQFGIKINPPYPYSDHIPRQVITDPYADEEKGGLVETIYLMIVAESGWHTLVVYLLFAGSFVFRAFRLCFTTPVSYFKMWGIGLGAGLTSILLNSCFEWVLKQSNNYYQLMLVFAVILVIERMAKQQRKTCRKKLTPRRI